VSPFAHALGPVPAFPLLAALPGAGLPQWVGAAALAVPMLAGALAGRLVLADLEVQRDEERLEPLGRGARRWRRPRSDRCAGPWSPAWPGCPVAPSAGRGWPRSGPSPWRVGLAVAVAVSVGALAAALLRRRTAQR
jgi:hypothetical protein